MLVDVRAKVAWIIDDKIKKQTETFILDADTFSQAEYAIMQELNAKKEVNLIDDYEILYLKVSATKEVYTQYEGEYSYVITLKDTTLQDDGSEKSIKYKVLLWASSITDAMSHAREIAAQGYDMQIDGLKEVNYTYLNHEEESTTSEN
jgi:hypothetical protein